MWLVRGPDLPTKWAKSGVGYRFRLHKSFHNVHLSKGRKCHLTKRGVGRSPVKKIFEVEYDMKRKCMHFIPTLHTIEITLRKLQKRTDQTLKIVGPSSVGRPAAATRARGARALGAV